MTSPVNNGSTPRRQFLKGIGIAALLIPIAAKFGLGGNRTEASGGSSPGFVSLGDGESPSGLIKPPSIPIILENVGPDSVEGTYVHEVADRRQFAKRAKIPMRELTQPPDGYSPAVYRVAENLSGRVPFASVTYELPDQATGLPMSIVSLIGRPRGAYPEPFPLIGTAIDAPYLPGGGFETRGRDRSIHVWYEGDNLYVFMHIVYEPAPGAVALQDSKQLLDQLQQI